VEEAGGTGADKRDGKDEDKAGSCAEKERIGVFPNLRAVV
jgi:hypothetical protein